MLSHAYVGAENDCNTQINIGEGENHTSVSRFVTSIVGYYRLNLGKRCETAWVRANYMGKPKNLVEKPNGLRHTVWEASESMGCVLMQCNFSFQSVQVI